MYHNNVYTRKIGNREKEMARLNQRNILSVVDLLTVAAIIWILNTKNNTTLRILANRMRIMRNEIL